MATKIPSAEATSVVTSRPCARKLGEKAKRASAAKAAAFPRSFFVQKKRKAPSNSVSRIIGRREKKIISLGLLSERYRNSVPKSNCTHQGGAPASWSQFWLCEGKLRLRKNRGAAAMSFARGGCSGFIR